MAGALSMRRVYVATTPLDAYLLRDLLSHAGIEAQVFNEFARGALGDIPLDAAQPQLWVDDEDQQRAESLVREFSARRAVAGTLSCPHCGEENPDSFELCWKCGGGL